jgi:multiple sugar transport system substrate-binding protein
MDPRKQLTRRTFLERSLAVAGGVALAPFLGACGSDRQSAGAFGLDPNEQVTIDYWHIYPGGSELLKEINRSFGEGYPNITVKVRENPTDYQALAQQVQADLAAGNPPAVVQVGYDALRYTADNLPHLNIEDAARRDPEGEGAEWLNDNFANNILDLGRIEGVLHFMPYSVSTPVLFYNQDAFEKAGLDAPPRTWEEVREHARRLTEETDLLGLSINEGNGSFWVLQGAMECNGAQVLSDAGDGYTCGVDSPAAIEAMRFAADMVLEDETAIFDRGLRGYENFAAEKVAMVFGSSAGLGIIRGGADFPFDSAVFPTFGDKPRRIPAGGNALGIFAEEEAQQAAAWEYVKHLLSPEAITTWDEGSGYLPPRKGIADDPRYLGSFYRENPVARAGLEQLPDAVPWVSFPGDSGLEALQVLVDACDRIFVGEQDVAATLEAATERVNRMIRQ